MLVAVAPIIGTARTMSAAINITEALGFAIAVMEERRSNRSGMRLTWLGHSSVVLDLDGSGS